MLKYANLNNFYKISKKYIHLMTQDEYLLNRKESLKKTYFDSCTLTPYQELGIIILIQGMIQEVQNVEYIQCQKKN